MSQNAFTRPFTKSRFAKEELPVWSEIWEQFAVNRAYTYDPDNPDHNGPIPASSRPEVILNGMDIYWQQPHRKLLLGWMANELNKLISEDGRLEEVNLSLNEIVGRFLNREIFIKNVEFELRTAGHGLGTPPVYTQLSPTTGERSIFASDAPSVDMGKITGKVELEVRITYSDHDKLKLLSLSPTDNEELITELLGVILEPIRIYFEEPVGWKDDDYVSEPLTRRCANLGVDPSL